MNSVCSSKEAICHVESELKTALIDQYCGKQRTVSVHLPERLEIASFQDGLIKPDECVATWY